MATPVPTGIQDIRRRRFTATGDNRQARADSVPQASIGADPGLSVNADQFGAGVAEATGNLGGVISEIGRVQQELENSRKGAEDTVFLSRLNTELTAENARVLQEIEEEGLDPNEQTAEFLRRLGPAHEQKFNELSKQYNPSPNTVTRARGLIENQRTMEQANRVASDHNRKVLSLGQDMIQITKTLAEGVLVSGEIDDAEARLKEMIANARGSGISQKTLQQLELSGMADIEQAGRDWAERQIIELNEGGPEGKAMARQVFEAIQKGDEGIESLDDEGLKQIARAHRTPFSAPKTRQILSDLKIKIDAQDVRDVANSINEAIADATVNKTTPELTPELNQQIIALGDKGEELRQVFNQQAALVTATNALLAAETAQERNAILEAATPNPDDPDTAQQVVRFETLQKANAQIESELEKDAFSHVMENDSEVEAAFEAAGDDPVAIEQAIDLSMERQAQRGALPNQIGVMPTSSAVEIAEQINAQTDAKPIIEAFEDLQAKFPRHFDRAVQQIVKAGGDKGLIVLPTVANDNARKELLVAMAVTRQEADFYSKGFESGVKNEIKTSVQETMRPFVQGLMPGSVTAQTGYDRAIQLLAEKRVAENQSVSDAVSSAFDDVLGEVYEFDGSLRIPKAFDAETVKRGLQKNMARPDFLRNENIFIEDVIDIAKEMSVSGLTRDQVKEIYLDKVLSTGRPITAPDDSGVMFLDERGNVLMRETDVPEIGLSTKRVEPIIFPWSVLTGSAGPKPPRGSLRQG